jgi:predicted patatin/cPLA2 family phospholipase
LNAQPIKTAMVVEGGGMRGVFSTGLLDGFMERHFDPFHMYIGVSAGATNIAAFLAEMHGRNRRIYTEFSVGPEFISLWRFLRGGHLMDLDWLWNLTMSRMRLDLSKIYGKGRPFIVGMTSVETGRAVFKETSADNLEHVLKASSALPFFYRGFLAVDSQQMTDGGVSEPIPVAEAIRRGATYIMVIRSRPRGFWSKPDPLSSLIKLFLHDYPLLQAALNSHDRTYNETVAIIRNPPAGVSIIEVCPPDEFRPGRLTRDARVLKEGYEQGRAMACDAIMRWERLYNARCHADTSILLDARRNPIS